MADTTQYDPCTLHQISEHVWWFAPESRTDRPSLGLVVGDSKTLLLDVGASSKHTKQFLEATKAAGLPEPDFAVLTHWHWDHSFGMDALDIPVAAHRETAVQLKRISSLDYSDKGLDDLVERGIEVDMIRTHMRIELTEDERKTLKIPQPDTLFESTHRYDLGNVTCEVVHVGGDHSADSCVMYIPEDKVLFMGDCFYYTVYEEPNHYTRELLKLVEKLEAFDAEKYIEGHWNEIGSRAIMHNWFALIKSTFALIDEHGTQPADFLRVKLAKIYTDDDIDGFLDPILTGLTLPAKE